MNPLNRFFLLFLNLGTNLDKFSILDLFQVMFEIRDSISHVLEVSHYGFVELVGVLGKGLMDFFLGSGYVFVCLLNWFRKSDQSFPIIRWNICNIFEFIKMLSMFKQTLKLMILWVNSRDICWYHVHFDGDWIEARLGWWPWHSKKLLLLWIKTFKENNWNELKGLFCFYFHLLLLDEIDYWY